MDSVSRPLIALLLGTVAVFALWLVALKPSSPASAGLPGLGTNQSAIDKAHQAVAISNAASVAHGGTVAQTPAVPARPLTTATTTSVRTTALVKAPPSVRQAVPPRRPATRISTPAGRLNVVTRALQRRQVLALLFYNPVATDDRAVRQELAAVPGHHGRVVKLAVPVAELARYTVVTNQVMVSGSPTLVIVDRAHQAATIVGFADRFEIAQRIQDALAVR